MPADLHALKTDWLNKWFGPETMYQNANSSYIWNSLAKGDEQKTKKDWESLFYWNQVHSEWQITVKKKKEKRKKEVWLITIMVNHWICWPRKQYFLRLKSHSGVFALDRGVLRHSITSRPIYHCEQWLLLSISGIVPTNPKHKETEDCIKNYYWLYTAVTLLPRQKTTQQGKNTDTEQHCITAVVNDSLTI